jgi:hypothetical protein
MAHSWLDNLRFISEYIFYDDAPALLGVNKSVLTRYVKGTAKPSKEFQARVAKIAGKMRRKQAQIERYEREEATRHARREVRQTLIQLGHQDLKIPDVLPPLIKVRESPGNGGSPLFIYDFRKMKPNDVLQFFRFMKTIVPGGRFLFNYLIEKGGRYPSADPRKQYKLQSDMLANSGYMDFCQNRGDVPGDACLLLTDLELFEMWAEYNDRSQGKHVLECWVTYPRPKWEVEHYQLTPEEIADDIARGADPVTGKKVIWQD